MWPNREQQFILSFLRFSLGYEPPEDLFRITSGDVDWGQVSTLATFHGIAPLLHDSLQREGRIHLPRPTGNILAKEYIANSALSLFFERALKTIVRHFKQNRLTFVVHKGLGLAALLYPKPELRPCGGDVDIFIRKQDYGTAKQLLEEIGYAVENISYEQLDIDYIGEVKFVKQESGKKLVVDLHTDFNANHWGKVSRFEMEGFWDSLLEVRYNDFSIPLLPVGVYLIFLSIHCAANHIFDRLITFCDLDLMVRKYAETIDWSHIANYARIHRSRKTLYHSLNYCRKLLGTPVPADFLKEIKPGSLSICLVPTKILLLRDKNPPKRLERYVHIILLDNPLHFFRSVAIFVRRILAELFMKKKIGPVLP